MRPLLRIFRHLSATPTHSIIRQSIRATVATPTNSLIFSNNYASKKKGKSAQVEETESIEFEWEPKNYFDKIEKIKKRFQLELNSLRVGKANASLLDTVHVDCGEEFGGILPLNQVGQVTVKDPQTLLVSVFDTKLVTAVERAIQSADLNLNPTIEKGKVRIPIPKLTKETRLETIKIGQKFLEMSKTNIRNLRQQGMKELTTGKKSGLDKDTFKQLETEFDQDIKKFVKQFDDLFQTKSKEIQSS